MIAATTIIYLMSNNNISVITGRKNCFEPIKYDKDKFKMQRRFFIFFAIVVIKYSLC